MRAFHATLALLVTGASAVELKSTVVDKAEDAEAYSALPTCAAQFFVMRRDSPQFSDAP